MAGEGASNDTTIANGRLISADLAEFERELIVERIRAGRHSPAHVAGMADDP